VLAKLARDDRRAVVVTRNRRRQEAHRRESAHANRRGWPAPPALYDRHRHAARNLTVPCRHTQKSLDSPTRLHEDSSFELEIDSVQGEAPLGWFSLAGPDRFAHVFFARASLQHSLLGVCREDDRRLL